MSRWALDRIRRLRRARVVDHEVLVAEAAVHGSESAQGWRYACEMAWTSNRERQAVLDRIGATLNDHGQPEDGVVVAQVRMRGTGDGRFLRSLTVARPA